MSFLLTGRYLAGVRFLATEYYAFRGLHQDLPKVDLRRVIPTAHGDVAFVASARSTLNSHRSMSEQNALLVWQGFLPASRFGPAISLRILVTIPELRATACGIDVPNHWSSAICQTRQSHSSIFRISTWQLTMHSHCIGVPEKGPKYFVICGICFYSEMYTHPPTVQLGNMGRRASS